MVDEILVCTWKIVVNDPVEVTLFGRELDVDPVGIRVNNSSRSPVQI